ncbi:ankyrin repeat-containing domain protein [Aspergillus germanicus]
MDALISRHAYTPSKYLLSICAGLVIVDKETDVIRLVHYTAKEYLERYRAEYLPHALDEVSSTYLKYLSLNIGDKPHWLKAVPETRDMFHYAALNLGKHLVDGVASSDIDQAMKFFEDRKSVSRAIMEGMDQWMGHNLHRPNQLHYAVYLKLHHILKLLHSTPEEFLETDKDGLTPLGYAVKTNSEVAVNVLIDIGSPVESRNDKGFTPLAMAIQGTKHDLTNLLLSAGASVNTVDKYGKSLLMLVAEKGDHIMVSKLLERGAAVNTREGSKLTSEYLEEQDEDEVEDDVDSEDLEEYDPSWNRLKITLGQDDPYDAGYSRPAYLGHGNYDCDNRWWEDFGEEFWEAYDGKDEEEEEAESVEEAQSESQSEGQDKETYPLSFEFKWPIDYW